MCDCTYSNFIASNSQFSEQNYFVSGVKASFCVYTKKYLRYIQKYAKNCVVKDNFFHIYKTICFGPGNSKKQTKIV